MSAPLHQIQFLSFSEDAEFGALPEAQSALLAALLRFDEDQPLPGDPGRVWITPQPPLNKVEENLDIEFGGASEVFNSLTSGTFESYRPDPNQTPDQPEQQQGTQS